MRSRFLGGETLLVHRARSFFSAHAWDKDDLGGGRVF